MSSVRVLTGITTTGTPHWQLRRRHSTVRASLPNTESFCSWPITTRSSSATSRRASSAATLEIAATWLAAAWTRTGDLLPPVRHPRNPRTDLVADLRDRQRACSTARTPTRPCWTRTPPGADPDDGVTAGLFMYPVLMAADILMFNAPGAGGRDQIQHIEMARDMARQLQPPCTAKVFGAARGGDRRQRGPCPA